ncbi:MAG TPA: DUF2087 domain-containing protein [Acidimicrobiia bacterium]
MAITATDFLRLVLDPDRLAVMGMAAAAPLDIEDAAHRLSLTVGQVRRAVAKLVEAGVLDANLSVDRAMLRTLASTLPQEEPVADAVLEGPWTDDERQILGRFFVGTRLTEVPAPRARRLVVLERLAHEFEVGLRYSEKEVNSILQTFHPDYATLRRHLVDEGFLSRADGSYWRTGGRVEINHG